MSNAEQVALVVTLTWFGGLAVGHLIHRERRADRKHRKMIEALDKATRGEMTDTSAHYRR